MRGWGGRRLGEGLGWAGSFLNCLWVGGAGLRGGGEDSGLGWAGGVLDALFGLGLLLRFCAVLEKLVLDLLLALLICELLLQDLMVLLPLRGGDGRSGGPRGGGGARGRARFVWFHRGLRCGCCGVLGGVGLLREHRNG